MLNIDMTPKFEKSTSIDNEQFEVQQKTKRTINGNIQDRKFSIQTKYKFAVLNQNQISHRDAVIGDMKNITNEQDELNYQKPQF